MSSTAQQFDFQAPKEQVLGILKNIAQAGLRIDYVGTKELPGPVTRVNLHHRMTAMTWGDSIAIDLLSNEDGSTHMNIVSSNSNAFTFGLHSKNISAIAQYVKREIEKSSPCQSKTRWANWLGSKSCWISESSAKKNSNPKRKSF